MHKYIRHDTVKGTPMKAKEYQVMLQAVETGVNLGWNRAYKHNENPKQGDICDNMIQEVMIEICGWFTFEGEEE